MTTPPLPEWAPHEAVWIGFPSDPRCGRTTWRQPRPRSRRSLSAVHAGGAGEEVWLVAANEPAAKAARTLAPFAKVIVEPFGDIWLRDTGAIVRGTGRQPPCRGVRLQRLGRQIRPSRRRQHRRAARRGAGLPYAKADWILEGGAIDGDGSGTVLTTEQCLLNPNRNPALDRADVEARLRDDLGFERIVWLGEGLANDHTDGHVDNLARFVAPGRVAIPIRRRRRS